MSENDVQLRVPAEWEPHRALWLAMPHDVEEWGPAFEAARQTIKTLIHQILVNPGAEAIELLVHPNDSLLYQSREAWQDFLSGHPGLRVNPAIFGDIWLRDTGPIFVHNHQHLEARSFAFNGWGQKYVMAGDSEVSRIISDIAQVPRLHHNMILEGGALECNGAGTFITTRQCLLNPNRNPGYNEKQVEQVLAKTLGAKHTIWLENGLLGDHTDGHVDNLARFVKEDQVLCMLPSDKSHSNAPILQKVVETLKNSRTAAGQDLTIVSLPSPDLAEGPLGPRPASYCNFLITNQSVIVPVFGVAQDSEALTIMADLFPKRQIVALEACPLLSGGGTVHCISQQEPLYV